MTVLSDLEITKLKYVLDCKLVSSCQSSLSVGQRFIVLELLSDTPNVCGGDE